MKHFIFLPFVLSALVGFGQTSMEANSFLSLTESIQSSRTNLQSPVIQKPLALQALGEDYRVSRPPGLRMRNIGTKLTIGGGAMFLGGLLLYNSVDDPTYMVYQNGSYYEEVDPKALLGVYMMVGGVGMTVPGVILWTKGAKKYKRHLEKTAAFQWKGNGASVVYQF